MASAIASQTVAKCISMDGHDRAVTIRGEEPVVRWGRELARWAIPEWILVQASASPWECVPADFRADDGPTAAPLSARFEREVIPAGGSVLDVGCGGGRASLALVPPGAAITGVDESEAMLAQLTATAADRAVPVEVVHGRWPDVAPDVAPADVVVCHHVVYNAPDIVPFLERADQPRPPGGRRRADRSPPAGRMDRRVASLLGSRPSFGTDGGRSGGRRPRPRVVTGGLAPTAPRGRRPVHRRRLRRPIRTRRPFDVAAPLPAR